MPKKLGIEAGHKVCLLNAPASFERHLLTPGVADDVRFTHDLRLPPVDVVVLFVDSLADLEKRFADIAARLHPQGGFWVAFPKRARRATDVTGEVVRRIALAAGMVDDKVASIGNWSGVRLVMREEIRDAVAYRAAPPTLSRRTRRPTAPARIVHRSTSGAGSTLRRARARSTR
jgi:hypothetical protein